MSIRLFLGMFMNVLLFSSLFSQSNNGLDIRNVDAKEFPKIEGNLWVRDPDGVKTTDVQFLENDKPVQVTFTDIKKNTPTEKNQAIVFLVLKSSNENETNWYKSILKHVATSDVLKEGDLFEVVTFSCKNDKQFVSPSSISFTSDKNELIKRISAISKINSRYCGSHSQIHLAINEVLSSLENSNHKIPTSIFVLSDNAGMKTGFTGEDTGERSLRLNVPIYGITYTKPVKDNYPINDLCKQTFGVFYRNNSNNLSETQDYINSLIENSIERSAGYNYSFSYNSTLSKDSKTHTVKVNSRKNGQTAFVVQTPGKNIIEWSRDNLFLAILIFVLIISGLVFLIYVYKRFQKNQKLREENQKIEMYELEQQQKEAEARILLQQKELEQFQKQEEEKKKQLELEKNRLLNEEEEKLQFKKMLEKGNLPWFVFGYGSETGNYQIQRPILKVGRSPEPINDWVVNHPSVSKEHFILTFKDYIYTIEDLNSTNGVVVNGSRVQKTQLKHGDLIKIGDISLTFYI